MAKTDKPVCRVDSVCNLDLEAGHGHFMYDFEDVTYYFCSEACKTEFAVQPQKFTKKEQ